MKLIALKNLPQGQRPGDSLEVTDEQGQILILVGAARLAVEEAASSSRRTYRRRDLRAED